MSRGFAHNLAEKVARKRDHRVRELSSRSTRRRRTRPAGTRSPDQLVPSVAVEETRPQSWVIVAKEVVMPGAIYPVDNPANPLIPGPCSTMATEPLFHEQAERIEL